MFETLFRNRWIRIVGALVALLSVTLLTAVTYLCLGGLGLHRHTVAGMISQVLDRELRFSGDLDIDLGRLLVLEAHDVSLDNPDWAQNSIMVSVDRLRVGIEFGQLLRGRLHLRFLEADGVIVHLERLDDGRASWNFPIAKMGAQATPEGEPVIKLDHALIDGVNISYNDPAASWVPELGRTHLEIRSDDLHMLLLDLTSETEGRSITAEGRFGPLMSLLRGRDLSYEIKGGIDDGIVEAIGHHERLNSARGMKIEAKIRGQHIENLTTLFGLPSLGSGAYHADAELDTTGQGVNLAIDASLGDLEVHADGVLASLTQPQSGHTSFKAHGPSLAAAAALVGLSDVPAETFKLNVEIDWSGSSLALTSVSARVGEMVLEIDGVLGSSPHFEGSDLRIDAFGPDLMALSPFVHYELPSGPFKVAGHLAHSDSGINVDALRFEFADHRLWASGTLEAKEKLTVTGLNVQLGGPDVSILGRLADIELPPEPYALRIRARAEDHMVWLDDIRGRIGESTLQLGGRVNVVMGFKASELNLQLACPDLAQWQELIPEAIRCTGPAQLNGRLLVDDKGLTLESVKIATLGSQTTVDGLVTAADEMSGSFLRFQTEGPELRATAAALGFSDLPTPDFRVSGRVDWEDDALRLDLDNISLGEIHAKLEGRLGIGSRPVASHVDFEFNAPYLDEIGEFVGLEGLPTDSLELSGHLRENEDGRISFDISTFRLGPIEVTGSGSFDRKLELKDGEIAFEVTAPSLQPIGTMLSGLVDLPELPELPLSVHVRLKHQDEILTLEGLTASLGRGRVSAEGVIGFEPEFVGTDLSLQIDGPDASFFITMTGNEALVAPFEVDGRIESVPGSIRFHDLDVRLGDYSASIDGALGEYPKFIGTELHVRAAGPSLRLIEQLADLPSLPEKPFEVEGFFTGTPERFRVQDLALRFGSNDLKGGLRVDLVDRPYLEATFQSERLDLSRLFNILEDVESIEEDDPVTSEEPVSRQRRLLSDEPFEFGFLDTFDGGIRWHIKELSLPEGSLFDIDVGLRMSDGGFEAGPISIRGDRGGLLRAQLQLTPVDGSYEMHAAIDLDQAQLRLSKNAIDDEQRTAVDLNLIMSAHGRSLHELATSATGKIAIVATEGLIDSSVIDILVRGILSETLRALIPFRKKRVTTDLECAVMLVRFENGIGVLDPFTIRSDTMTLMGGGRVDFDSERISFEWAAKPRSGIGLSASAVSNRYLQIGGTISKPKIEVDPLDAITVTSVAVATGGLSLLGRGLIDRISAEGKICQQAVSRLNEEGPLPKAKWWQLWK